jgi:hypothetical protein
MLSLSTVVASAQNFTAGNDRLIIGGSAGIFRISYDGFNRLYGGRSGLTLGAAAMAKVYAPYYAMLKYRQFEKDGTVNVDSASRSQQWKENWYNVGVRYHSFSERKVSSYFGFGFAFFNIEETGPFSIFGQKPGKRNASGFFLDGGFEYRFINRASFYFEIEVTSAGIKGKSGFEGSSVGGFLVGLGVNVFILYKIFPSRPSG